ncbi:MAG: hypothetical protein ACO3SZ_04355 [Ilumatobacteraceae bacterium]
MIMKSDVKRLATIFATTVGMLALAGCGGGDLIAEATAKADGACECDNFECTTDFIGWFNEVSITRESDLEALGETGYSAYLEQSLRAADCQDALR